VVAAVAVGVAHATIVAGRYHVGSFDDDAAYVMLARAIASGHGLTSRLAGGYPLVGVYPPGYPALLSPLAALWPASVVPFRLLPLAMFVAIFPLTELYLRRLAVAPAVRAAVLALLALNPVLATYATMTTPETSFVVFFLLLVLFIGRWEKEARWSPAGVATVAAAAGTLWLKEAGVGIVAGVALWLLLGRRGRRALAIVAGSLALFAPLLVMRWRAGANLLGSRYSRDFGVHYHGSLAGRAGYYVTDGLWSYFSKAMPRTVVPIRMGLLPSTPPVSAALSVLTWTATPLVLVGVVVWWRHHRDPSGVAVLVYVAETLVYPYINERRVVLVLPVVLFWYVLGAHAVWAAAVTRARRMQWRAEPALRVAVPLLAAALVVANLGSQFPRDYLYAAGSGSSNPAGSPYMTLLHQLGASSDVVETDYLWTTALDSSHRTRHGVYLAPCDVPSITAAVGADHAGYLLTGDLNRPGAAPVDCVLPAATAFPGAVRLMRTPHDKASVFQLVGPGTGHPDLRDRAGEAAVAASSADGSPTPVVARPEPPQAPGDRAGTYPTATSAGGAIFTWSWPAPVAVTQLSIGDTEVEPPGATAPVSLAVRLADGTVRTLARGAAGAPFLLVPLPGPLAVRSVLVTVSGPGASTVAVHDFHALGPA
jgi:hypothetical protein